MNECAPKSGESAAFEPASVELRASQRVFADLIDAHRRVGEFRGAQLRSAARRTLSALSADDRARLADWLSLVLAADDRHVGDGRLDPIARLDAPLLARVRRALPARVEALANRGGANHIDAA
jgi:hypothetical protein